MQALNLPSYDLRRAEHGGKEMIFDPVREKYVRLTPEEWVRQHFVQYLLQDRGVPAGLIAVEKRFAFEGMPWRADVVVHSRNGAALLMAECKAPGVDITQDAFDQVARYDRVAKAGCLVVTNGLDHYCCRREGSTYRFLDRLPHFEELIESG